MCGCCRLAWCARRTWTGRWEQSQDADAGPVGDLLVRVGAVEREEVEHFVRIQLVDMISDLLGWDLIGTAVFAGDIPPKALDEPFGVDVVLREAMERREVWEAMVQRFGVPRGAAAVDAGRAPGQPAARSL